MFADLMIDYSAWIRLTAWLVVVVGLTEFLVWRFHDRILARYRAAQPAEPSDDATPGPPAPPSSADLTGHLVRVLSLAFVFILGFTLSNFWGATKAADAASQDEAANFNRAVVIARTYAPDAGGKTLLDALDAYAQNASEVQWPLLQRADAPAAYQAQENAGSALFTAVVAGGTAGAGQQATWDTFTSAIDDMLSAGRERIDALPSTMSDGVLWILGVLALANLVAIAVYAPTNLRTSLFVLGLLAAVLALLMFVIVETSNPYWGAGAHMAVFTTVAP